MNPEEMRYMEQQDTNVQSLQIQNQQMQNQQMQQQLYMDNQEKSMIKEQIDLSEELRRIELLLRGYSETTDEDGSAKWVAPESQDMVILSAYGIKLVMNTISWYINKNTLLSNYDDEVINRKMEDFSTDLADTIFMEYEKVFLYPNFEDCKKILLDRMEYQLKLKKFAKEIIGDYSEVKITKEELLDSIQGGIEGELNKIKERVTKEKLKRFLILMRTIQDTVHSTYRRAFRGDERRTLRQHIHISETKGGGMPTGQQGSRINPFNWIKR